MKLSRFNNSMPNIKMVCTNSSYPEGVFTNTNTRVTPLLYFDETNKFSLKGKTGGIKCYPNQTLYTTGTFLSLGSKQSKTLTINTKLELNKYKELLTDIDLLQCWKNKTSVKITLSGSNIDSNALLSLNLIGESAVYKINAGTETTPDYYTVSFNVDSSGKLHYASDCSNMSTASTINAKGISIATLVIEYYPSTQLGNSLKASQPINNFALGNSAVDLLEKTNDINMGTNGKCFAIYSDDGKVRLINANGKMTVTDSPMGQPVRFSSINNMLFMHLEDVACNKLWYTDTGNSWTEVTLPLYYNCSYSLFTKIYDPATDDLLPNSDSSSNIIYMFPASSYSLSIHDTADGAAVSKGMYSTNNGKTWEAFTSPVKYGTIYKYNSCYIISSSQTSSCVLYHCPYFFFPVSDTTSLTSVTFASAYHQICTLQGYLCCFPDTTSTSNSKYYYSSDGKTWTSKSITSGKWGMKIWDNTKVILGYTTGSGPLADQYQTYNFLVITNPTSGASSSSGSETSNPSHPKWYTNTRGIIYDKGYNFKIAQWASKTYVSIDGGSFTQASGISAPSGLIRAHGSCFLCYSSKTLYRSLDGINYSSVVSFPQNINRINIINGLIIIQIGTSKTTGHDKLYVSYNNGSTFEEIQLPGIIYWNTGIHTTDTNLISCTYYIDSVENIKMVGINYFLHPTISETLQNQEEILC